MRSGQQRRHLANPPDEPAFQARTEVYGPLKTAGKQARAALQILMMLNFAYRSEKFV